MVTPRSASTDFDVGLALPVMRFLTLCLSGLALFVKPCLGFYSHQILPRWTPNRQLAVWQSSANSNCQNSNDDKQRFSDDSHISTKRSSVSTVNDRRRRSIFQSFGSAIVGALVLAHPVLAVHALESLEEPPTTDAIDAPTIEMKDFVDPAGYFSIRVPKYFFTIRRSVKGDLPDPKTGQGRRGSSIFTAGDMNKAELVAIERFPTRSLLEENGIEASGDLSSFTSLGDPVAVANLLSLRRDRDKAGTGMSNTQLVPGSIYLTSDGLELSFKLKTEIEVQKPELLMEQYGVSELYRITTAKASLASRDGNLMAVYASALETDFSGPDGKALQDAVNSFEVTDQSGKS